MTTEYAFTGQMDETGIGLVYMHARWYAPGLMRWVSADAIVPNPANPQGLNRYTYVYGNPLRLKDTTGHLTDDELRTLLGDDYDTLMPLWEQCDSYWVAVLRELEPGGTLWASMLGDIQLHIESAAGLHATVYNGTYSSRLEDWQAQGAYRIWNTGMTEDQSYEMRDRLFDQYENSMPNTLLEPVFDYRPAETGGRLMPRYRGARCTNQVRPTGVSSWTDYVFPESDAALFGLITDVSLAVLGDPSVASALRIPSSLAELAGPIGLGLLVADVFFSVIGPPGPMTYSDGWPFGVDVNPHIPWSSDR